jgi:glycosyltransferase involved in cell wall biosynthesis
MFPKASIIIPVFNGSNYLSQAIDSALNQDYDNFEVIVVNDGSDDELASEKIALSYGEKIRYYSQENKGVANAWNKGIELSTGDYISFLSHDDLYAKNKISAQMRIARAQNDPNAIIYSNWVIIDENNVDKENISLPNLEQSKFFLYYLLNQSLHGCTLLIPKRLFEIYGNFDESLISTCDYDYILRLAQYTNFILCPEILVKGRKHSEQYTYKATKHSIETQSFFVKYIQAITKDRLNKAFSGVDQPKYLYNLYAKLLSRNFTSAILILFRQLFFIYNDNQNLIKELLYRFCNDLPKIMK